MYSGNASKGSLAIAQTEISLAVLLQRHVVPFHLSLPAVIRTSSLVSQWSRPAGNARMALYECKRIEDVILSTTPEVSHFPEETVCASTLQQQQQQQIQTKMKEKKNGKRESIRTPRVIINTRFKRKSSLFWFFLRMGFLVQHEFDDAVPSSINYCANGETVRES